MFEFLLAATTIALVAGVVVAYYTTRDVMHPMVFLGPLFAYGTVLDPWLVRTSLSQLFVSSDDVLYVLVLDLCAVVALVVGALRHGVGYGTHRRPRNRVAALTESESELLLRIALGLGAWAMASYAWSLANAGGFVVAYSQVKGGGSSSSGYLSEGMNLGLVTAVMAALSRFRRGWTPASLGVLALGLIPNFLQGTFGGRRGPLFLTLAAATLAWVITRRSRPRLWVVWPALAVAGVAVMFVFSQRQFLYLGSNETVNWEQFAETLGHERADVGSNFIYGAGFITTVRRAGQFTWGRELAVNLLVRPIPRQVWPTKYEDVGATWITSNYPGLGHVTQGDWLGAVGWLPLAGSSAISISDVYGEFGWGVVAVFYVIGRGFAELYARRRAIGGMWQLLYLEALTLSIYLATQSFSAFYHRYLLLAIPTVVIWRVVLDRRRSPNVLPRRVRHLGLPDLRKASGSAAGR